MISVLLTAYAADGRGAAAPSDVVRSLSAFVPAIVEGLARDACVLAPVGSSDLVKVCDHAGCALIEMDRFAQAVIAGAKQGRCDHILVAEAGVMVDRSFLDELANVMPALLLDGSKRRYGLRRTDTGLKGRLFPALTRTVGVLTERAMLLDTEARDFSALVRSARPLRPFKSRAWTGG